MQKLMSDFWKEENGQDKVEYTLLLGVATLAGVESWQPSELRPSALGRLSAQVL
jgi:hypothetical protein